MTLVYVEHQDGTPEEVSLQALALARGLAGGGEVHALVAGASAEAAVSIPG